MRSPGGSLNNSGVIIDNCDLLESLIYLRLFVHSFVAFLLALFPAPLPYHLLELLLGCLKLDYAGPAELDVVPPPLYVHDASKPWVSGYLDLSFTHMSSSRYYLPV